MRKDHLTGSRRAPPGYRIIAFLLCLALFALPSALAQYTTSTGTKPELQSMRLVDGQTVTISSSFEILVETGTPRYDEIATILKDEIEELLTLSLPQIQALSAIDSNQHQIVIGDTSNATIKSLAADHGQSTLALGEEGYCLISLPNPNSTNNSWLILIVANEPKGALRGAFALLDIIEDGEGDDVANVRVRDYPNSQLRDIQHWIENDTTAKGAAWLAKRKREFRDLAAAGCNSVSLGRANSHQLTSEAHAGTTYGEYLKLAIDQARYYGIEPNVEIHWPAPNTYLFPDGWQWREGEFIKDEPKDEPFVIVDTLGGLRLGPVYRFDNAENNTGFDSLNASGWPDPWFVPDVGTENRWSFETVGQDVRAVYSGSNQSAKLRLTLYTPGDPEPKRMQSSSFYVLKGVFSNVDWSSSSNKPATQFHLWGDDPSGPPTGGEALPAEFGANAVSLHPWREFEPATFTIRKSADEYEEDYCFWTPPTREEAESLPGYPGPYFDDLTAINIQITLWGPPEFSNVSIKIHDLFLERRASSLRNVMWWDGSDLDFTVKSADGSTTYTDGK